MSQPPDAPRYRFGVFELDTRTGELRRGGLRVRLHAQPAELLRMLLERPGEMLTREEIAGALWPAGTFVDYEHGVHSAVNRLREALGDRARNPRFVETVARRGYRFVAPVERVPSPEMSGTSEAPAFSPSEVPQTEADEHGLAGTNPEAVAETRREGTGWLASAEDLPAVSPRLAGGLFLLLQAMYLAFYVGALANLVEVGELLEALEHDAVWLRGLEITAALLIPVRAFLLCAVLFGAPHLLRNYLRMWPFLLLADLLWAPSPLLLLHHMAFGLALACVPLLVYSPFAQRALMLMLSREGH